ncbi:MAG: FAD-dependent monooxygenase [Gammaproteobacteria bacterium]|nr:FAD-dependent monooxygenase [Gammaproteobacteria bacterium]
MTDTQVVVVGGGPVGLGLALDLSLRGIETIVLERTTALHQIPKGQNLTQRSGELFKQWEIAEQVRSLSPIPRSFGNAGVVTYQTLLGAYRYDWFQRSSVGQFYFAENERLPQYLLEQVMRERVDALPNVTLKLGCEVTDIHAGDTDVSLSYQCEGKSQTLTASYLVGCDGARSVVRSQTSLELATRLQGPQMVLLVFRSKELDELLVDYPGKSIFNVMNPELQGYWQFLGRYDLDGGWFFHMPVDSATGKQDAEAFKQRLHEIVGKPFALEFEHIGYWDLRIRHAQSYRDGRVFIAGDAAHSHPPYGGYGVNTGLEDAANLGWKLAAVLNGWGTNALLESYSTERHAVFESVSADFIERMIADFRSFLSDHSPDKDKADFEEAWNARANADDSDVTQFLPNYAGSPIIFGAPGASSSALGVHQLVAQPGYHLAPLPDDEKNSFFIQSDYRERAELNGVDSDLFSKLTHGGYTLLNLDNDQIRLREFERAFAQQSVPLVVLSADNKQARALYGAGAVLVRPDLYVAWTNQTAETSARDVLQKVLGG